MFKGNASFFQILSTKDIILKFLSKMLDMRESYMIHEIVHSKDQFFLSDGWTAGSAIAQHHVNSF